MGLTVGPELQARFPEFKHNLLQLADYQLDLFFDSSTGSASTRNLGLIPGPAASAAARATSAVST